MSQSRKKTDSAAQGREDQRRRADVEVEGPKGKLTVPIPAGISFRQQDGMLELLRDTDEHAALHGLTRALAANAVQGVSTGFTRELDIVGIGYRADMKGQDRDVHAGLFASDRVLLPDGVDMKIDKQTHLVLSGCDRQLLGQVAANIRALRPPDPYKNKGVRYTGEVAAQEGRQDRGQQEASNMARNLPRTTIRAADSHAHRGASCKGTPERPRLAVFRSVKQSTRR